MLLNDARPRDDERSASGALIDDVEEARGSDEGAFGGDWMLADREELLAVEEAHGVEVWDERGDVPGSGGAEGGDDAIGGEEGEGGVVFVEVGEVGGGVVDVEAEVCVEEARVS